MSTIEGKNVTFKRAPTKTEESVKSVMCCSVTRTCSSWVFAILAFCSLVTVIVLVCVFWGGTSSLIAMQRYLIEGTSANGQGSARGLLVFDSNSRLSPVSWFILTTNVSEIISMGIYGPIGMDEFTGPLVFALCGLPSSLVCTVNGTIVQGDPGGFALTDIMAYIRAYPYAYYFNISTTDFPSGDVISFLGTGAGRA